MTNPYNKDDDNLLKTFHRENPDFDLMNAVNDELHKISAAPCRIYKFDKIQSVKDPDGIYEELIYRTYLPPIMVGMYYIEPTWTEELSRLGINMPEEVVFSTNLQRMIDTIQNAKVVSSSAEASIRITYDWEDPAGISYEEPDELLMYHDGEGRLYAKLVYTSGDEYLDPLFELNYSDRGGIIDLNHSGVYTVDKLVNFIDRISNYSAQLVTGSNSDVLSSRMIHFNDWIDIKGSEQIVMLQRTGGVYDNVTDVLEAGDLIETFRRHVGTRNEIEPIEGLDGSPTHDPVTGSTEVRGKIYEVRYAFVANETPTWHYVNYNVTADKIPLDVYDQLMKNLPEDEAWTVGEGPWYA